MAKRAGKNTQRERLLRGLVEVSNRQGCGNASVAAIISQAGVSRPTFYDYFTDRDACVLAAIDDIHTTLIAAVGDAVNDAVPENATAAAIDALVAFSRTEPALALFVMSSSMAGGEAARDARDRGIASLAQIIKEAHRDAPATDMLEDLDHCVLIGGIYRVLSTRLRRGESAAPEFMHELLAWIRTYEAPVAAHRWATLTAAASVPRSPHPSNVPIHQAPDASDVNGRRLSGEQVVEAHRLRILHATAKIAKSKGYAATTVADISSLARVDPHAFYRLFSDKQDAFMSVHKLGFQQVMDVTSRAFFAGKDWPERSWEAGHALTQLLEDNPVVAYVGFVEAHAVGPAVQRIEDSHTAFMFFLQEGLAYRKQATPPSRLAMEATITSIFEIIYQHARNDGTPQVAAMLPHIAHLWLTPFLGPKDANKFIDRQLATCGTSPLSGSRSTGSTRKA